jgi:hypothetical protein
MDEDTLKKLWMKAGNEQEVRINPEKLIESVKKKLLKMEKLIKRRDRLEIIFALTMFALFTWWLIVVPILAVKIGSAIILLACLLVIFRLVRASRVHLKERSTSDIKNELMISLVLVRNQINLLSTVLWWYLLPFFVGIVCIFYAYLHSVLSFSIYTLIVALVYAYIWYGNKKSVKNHLQPLEKNLTRIIDELSTPE